MSFQAATYLLYTAVSVTFTVWVARTLHRTGHLFLVDVFGDVSIARAVNALLVVGFCLLNLAFVALALKLGDPVSNGRQLIEALGHKVGSVLFVLGTLHLLNLFIFSRIRSYREDLS